MTDLHVYGDAPELLHLIESPNYSTQTWACFSSPEALAQYLETLPEAQYWNPQRARRDIDFIGATFKQSCKMLREGWQEGAERVAKIRERINVARPHAQRLTRWSVAGAYPNVPRMLAGDPCHMRAKARSVARTKPIITLVCNMTGSAYLPKQVFLNKAAVITAIVDAIEEGGFSCHVIATGATYRGGAMQSPIVTVKNPGEHVDVARMAFALGHVAMFRSIVFCSIASRAELEFFTCGFGTPFELKAREGYMVPNNNTTKTQFASEDSAVTVGLDCVLKALREQGCPALQGE